MSDIEGYRVSMKKLGATMTGNPTINYDGKSYAVCPEIALAVNILLAQHGVARAPIIIAQDSDTGLVEAVFRVPDSSVYNKVVDALSDGSPVTAVEQHFQLHEQDYTVVNLPAGVV